MVHNSCMLTYLAGVLELEALEPHCKLYASLTCSRPPPIYPMSVENSPQPRSAQRLQACRKVVRNPSYNPCRWRTSINMPCLLEPSRFNYIRAKGGLVGLWKASVDVNHPRSQSPSSHLIFKDQQFLALPGQCEPYEEVRLLGLMVSRESCGRIGGS